MNFKLSLTLRLALIVSLMLPLLEARGEKPDYHPSESPLPPNEAAQSMVVPDGFRVTLFAGEPDVMQPIGFCLDDRARLWVAEAYNYPVHGTRPGDRIVILEDSDGDGRHDRRKVFAEGLNYVSGIEWGFGGAWVMSPPNMYFIPDRDGDDVPDGDPQIVLDGFGTHANAHNIANGFAWGPDGWLYATHGRTNWSMIGRPGDDDSQRRRFDGGVWRYHPVRDVWEPYADGTTNPWGIDWNDVGDSFICNCVNPHLFQVIQGAHYEPWRGRENSEYAYQRIDTIADHLHFVGLGGIRSGIGSAEEDSAGGGHAHCGTMIYLGDNFPESYRNQLFTNNVHGRRINNDLLRRAGSGYVASHGPDLMRSADPWFMGVTLAYGPGGEVYVSDWSDTGECHSTKNTRRHTGRIYRITFLDPTMERPDVGKLSNMQLVELQTHANDWWVRHARRLLHERFTAGDDMSGVHTALRAILHDDAPSPKRLRALWALHVTEGLSPGDLENLLGDDDVFVRGWAVTLLCEDSKPSSAAIDRFVELATGGDSPRVRLSLASAMQRLSGDARWRLGEALASRGEDEDDPNLPLMTWYGIEPLINDDLERYVDLAATAALPRVRQNMARRIASSSESELGLRLLSAKIASSHQDTVRLDLVNGIIEGLEGRRRVSMPTGWPIAYAALKSVKNSELRTAAIELAMTFDDREAIHSLRQMAKDRTADPEQRRQTIVALFDHQIDDFGRDLVGLLQDPEVRRVALRGLSRYDIEAAPEEITALYASLPDQEKQTALQTLASRQSWSMRLLDELENGTIAPTDVTAFTARQLSAFGDAEIDRRLAAVWGNVRETPREKAKQIEELEDALSPATLASADLDQGKRLFQKHCATCHTFFGEGGSVGPDITGAQRTNVKYLLENIIDPSASVAREFRMQVLQTDDGRVLTGLIESITDDNITIVNANERVVLPIDEVVQLKESEVSVMPSGLLETLTERQIRDLFGYLRR